MSDLKNIQAAYDKQQEQIAVLQLELQKNKAATDQMIVAEKDELKSLNADQRKQRQRAIFYFEEKHKLSGDALKNLIEEEARELRGLSDDQKAERKKAEIAAGKKKELADHKNSLTGDSRSLKNRFSDLAGNFFTQLNPVEKIAEMDDAFPILMFPLRLECRFKQEFQQLYLRVYPDDCNINSKEDLLSESELKSAQSFWIEIWKAGGIESEQKAAWKSLVSSHGSGRSAWIIQQYKPTNNKPGKPDAGYKILVVRSSLALTVDELRFARDYWAAYWLAKGNTSLINTAFDHLKAIIGEARAIEIREKFVPVNLADEVPADIVDSKIILEQIELPENVAKQSSWTQAAKATALPDKFVAIAFNGSNKRTILFSKPVTDNLPTSVDPSLEKEQQITKDANDNLVLNDELQWMVDFEKAIEAGMATKIDLSAQEAENGFDKLFVVGIRFTANQQAGAQQLEKLFTDHFYSKNGFGLLKQGTPTNNTEDEPAGFSWTDNADESFERIFKHSEDFVSADELDKKSDGEKLADCLGIKPDLLKLVPNANGKDQAEANAMNTALFPATLGYFMEEMMTPLFTERDIDATKTFFANFVSGRGPLPAIRIGKQPYGILPISPYSRLNFSARRDDTISVVGNNKTPFLERLKNLLLTMDGTWANLVSQVAHVGKAGDSQQILLDVISLHATSVEFHQRYSQSIQQLYNQLVLQEGHKNGTLLANYISQKGKTILAQLGIDSKGLELPILEKYFLSKPNLLSGHFVDDVPDSETNKVRFYSNTENYIQWLANSNADTIRTENFSGNPAPTALLYLLLRHALMQAQADAASRVLVTHQVIESKKVFHDPVFLHVEENGAGKSKFEHLYNSYPAITGNDSLKLADYIYNADVLKNQEAVKRLNETINALKILSDTPTARLERLLAEHLDCCNYRIDAWKTGLVQYKLAEQRNDNKRSNKDGGLYLGAYGWLLDVKPSVKNLSPVQLNPELTAIFNDGNNSLIQKDSANLGYIHAPSLNQAGAAAILRNAYDSNKSSGANNPFAINLTSDRVRIAGSFLEGMRNGQSLSALLGYQFERGLHDKYDTANVEADVFIYPLRKAFPLVADNLIDTKSDASDSIETVEANNVIDGLKLINHVQNGSVKTYPFGLPASLNLPPVNAATQASVNAVNAEVKKLIAIHDAISDLVISEQVYQVVQGNFERAAGNAEAFSKGNYPPDIDIVDTVRSGITLSHRMAIQFDTAAIPVAGATARAAAEPAVNKWLTDHFPDPEKVLCKVTYSSPVKAETEITVSQKNLGLEAIDLLYVFNTDTEQAMTELDDRIVHYVRYEISKHPKTDIRIDYTKIIDSADRSKISFFEMCALIKSIRKFLIGVKHLQPSSLAIPKEGVAIASAMKDEELATRVEGLKTALLSAKTTVENILAGTKSILGLSAALKVKLATHITDTNLMEKIVTQFKQDAKVFLLSPTAATKDTLSNVFETNISIVSDAGIIATLKNDYRNFLDNYATDFQQFDTLAKDTVNAFSAAAFLQNDQTGTGFIHQGITGIYNTVFSKLDTVIERWDKKNIEFNNIMAAYDAGGLAEVQFPLLQKAERVISSQPIFPLPASFADYKADTIDMQKSGFDALLIDLKALKSNAQQAITSFFTEAETTITNIGIYDVMKFDIANEKNNLDTEKITIALLKEDIAASLSNLQQLLEKKNTEYTALFADVNATMVNSEKIKLLLALAKKITGDEALLIPHFSIEDPVATEMENSYNAKDDILEFVKANENRVLPVEDWLGGVARVREKIHEWENAVFLFQAFNPSVSTDIAAVQLPFQENDRWLAMKFRDKAEEAAEPDSEKWFTVKSDKLLYSAHFANGFDKTKTQCGIVLDEWTEVIPAEQETTGIAFHYDQPNSEPPQTMLLVTTPQISGNWKWDDIIDAMSETLDMAKKRAVEPSQIEQSNYAQFLPATMMAVTMHWITVATNLAINNNIYKKINSN